MRASHTGYLVVTAKSSPSGDAVFLGICSLATQTVFLRFVLSSQTGGELYAAMALGGWIIWVGIGSLIGSRLAGSSTGWLWLALGAVKLPIALLIFVYPAFFTGTIDPLRYWPLAFFGMALPGILYGLIFAALIGPQSKASRVYMYEASGSVVGGLLAVVWIMAGGGDFGLLIFVSIVEFSRFFENNLRRKIFAVCGVFVGVIMGPRVDLMASNFRWSGFQVEKVAVGLSGRWELLARGDQVTIAHNGRQVASIPDRASSEEALLWPFLYNPAAENILMIGYEGILPEGIIPRGVRYLSMYGDKAFLDLDAVSSSNYKIADPLDFSPESGFDIVSVMLQGAGNLSDYRKETDLFFKRCGGFLSEKGILYVSAPSNENYISPDLAEYLASLRSTLKSEFAYVTIIPGPRAGFICSDAVNAGQSEDKLLEAASALNLDSPYFNMPLISNRLSPLRVSNLESSIGHQAEINGIAKPGSVLRYLKWQGSIFGRSGIFFHLYRLPYLLIILVMLLAAPAIIGIVRTIPFSGVFGVTLFGFAGMAFEIAVLYLFSTLFGSLYLHIGFLLAVFMAGLAVGAGIAVRVRPFIFFLLIMISAAAIALAGNSHYSFLSLKATRIMLYMISLAAGFATGGGFAHFAEPYSGGSSVGATLYAADLYGALAAAVCIPGFLMSSGTTSMAGLTGFIGIIILATLTGKKE